MYLAFFDDTPRKDVTVKLREAIAAYQQRFHEAPRVAVINEADGGAALDGLRIITRSWIQKNTYWLGMSEPS